MELKELLKREVAAALARLAPLPPGSGPTPADSMAGWLTIEQMISHMPPGARSDSSVRRWITDKLLHAQKRRGRWAIDPKQAFEDIQKVKGGAASVKEYLAAWTAKQAEVKRVRFGSRKYGAKRQQP